MRAGSGAGQKSQYFFEISFRSSYERFRGTTSRSQFWSRANSPVVLDFPANRPSQEAIAPRQLGPGKKRVTSHQFYSSRFDNPKAQPSFL